MAGTAAGQDYPAGIIAEASAQPSSGAIVVWTVLPGLDVDGFEVSRSRAGSSFTIVGTAEASATTYTDVDSQPSDIYMVTAAISSGATVTSNPAPALPVMDFGCPLVEFIGSFPFVELHLECIGPNSPSLATDSPSPDIMEEPFFAGTPLPGLAW